LWFCHILLQQKYLKLYNIIYVMYIMHESYDILWLGIFVTKVLLEVFLRAIIIQMTQYYDSKKLL